MTQSQQTDDYRHSWSKLASWVFGHPAHNRGVVLNDQGPYWPQSWFYVLLSLFLNTHKPYTHHNYLFFPHENVSQ